jgi:flagellar biosynthetic protein FliR
MDLCDTSPDTVALIVARCFGLIVGLPLGDAVTSLPRLGLALGLGVAVAPAVQVSAGLSPLALVFEFVVGLLLAAPLRVLAELSEACGELIDTARGQTVAAIQDPLNGPSVSDMATLLRVAVVTVALQYGGLTSSVEALSVSYSALPAGGVSDPSELARAVFAHGSELLAALVSGCAIWLTAFLVIDLGCACVARLARGIQCVQLGATLKLLVMCALLWGVVTSQGGSAELRRFLGQLPQLGLFGAAHEGAGGRGGGRPAV